MDEIDGKAIRQWVAGLERQRAAGRERIERLEEALRQLPNAFENGAFGLIGHYTRGDHRYSGIDIKGWLKDYVRAAPAAAPEPKKEDL